MDGKHSRRSDISVLTRSRSKWVYKSYPCKFLTKINPSCLGGNTSRDDDDDSVVVVVVGVVVVMDLVTLRGGVTGEQFSKGC